MAMSNEECKCSSVCNACTFIFFIITMVCVLISYENFILDETECNVVNVTYPVSIPSNNNESHSENFVDCNCGKRCVSDLGYCIKIFINVTGVNDNIYNNVMAYGSIDDNKYGCTFFEKKCINGESINNRIQALSDAYNIAKPYIDIMNNGSSIDCYTYNDKVYLENDIIQSITIISVTGSIFIVTLAFSLYFWCC